MSVYCDLKNSDKSFSLPRYLLVDTLEGRIVMASHSVWDICSYTECAMTFSAEDVIKTAELREKAELQKKVLDQREKELDQKAEQLNDEVSNLAQQRKRVESELAEVRAMIAVRDIGLTVVDTYDTTKTETKEPTKQTQQEQVATHASKGRLSARNLLDKLRAEVRELSKSIEDKTDFEQISCEAADVANYAMMLACNEGDLCGRPEIEDDEVKR